MPCIVDVVTHVDNKDDNDDGGSYCGGGGYGSH